jgi:hypothetical protein
MILFTIFIGAACVWISAGFRVVQGKREVFPQWVLPANPRYILRVVPIDGFDTYIDPASGCFHVSYVSIGKILGATWSGENDGVILSPHPPMDTCISKVLAEAQRKRAAADEGAQ